VGRFELDGSQVQEASRVSILTVERKAATVGYVGRRAHAHGHTCFFLGCPFELCKRDQFNAKLYGFRDNGQIAKPPPSRFPWEQVA
jgi:hypothetical protein